MRKGRVCGASADDDPLEGMVNLFDVWVVVAVCFLLTALHATDRAAAFRKLPRHRASGDALSGKGGRLGIAYRLQSGEIVDVPERSAR